MNEIWTYLLTLISGIIVGIVGSYEANRLSERAKKKDNNREWNKEFEEISKKIPELLKEMKEDLENPEMELCREFIISPSKSVLFNSSKRYFGYYEDEHHHLTSKIAILKQAGYIINITEANTPKYRFTEDFVKLLIKAKK